MNNDQGRANFSVSIDNEQLRQGAQESKNILHGIGQSAKKEADSMDSAFATLGKTIGGVFAVGTITSFAKQIVSLRGEIQSLEISFETLAGKTKGDALFKDIREFAVQTPMMLKDLASGAQTMLAFNIEVEKVMPMLKSIGDISMGDAQKFNSLTLAFSQMSATGKLMGQDLLQMINAGFNPLSVIAEKTGKTIGELKEEMEKGKISTQMVTEAFMDATSEGGKFNGMLEKQSKGINGAISNLQGAIDDMMNAIGTATEETTLKLVDIGTELAKNYEQTGRAITSLIATYGVYKTTLVAITAAEGWATAAEVLEYNALLALEKAQKLLNKTMLSNPYVLAATALMALVTVMVSAKTATERMRDAEDNYNNAKQEAIAKEEQHRKEIEKLCSIASDESLSTDTRRTAMTKLIQMYPDLFKKYKTETEMLEHIRDVKKEIAELDGKTSITNTKNELSSVDKRIKELEKLAKTQVRSTTVTTSSGMPMSITEKGLDSNQNAELQMLKKKRAELTKKVSKDEKDNFFANLTGVSNDDLSAMIQTRKDLLAKMDVSGNSRGVITGEGTTAGRYTREELEGQKQLLEAQQAERNKEKKSVSEWAASAESEYKKALKAYNDYLKGSSKDVSKNEADEQLKKLKAELDAAKKVRDSYSEQTDSKAKSAASKAAQEKKRQNQTTVEIAERNREIEEIKNAQMKANRDAALEVAQDNVNLEKDGIDKTLKQIEIDKKRMENAISDREDDLLEQYRNVMEKAWKNANPKAKDEGLSFDRTSISKADMKEASTKDGNEWLADALSTISASKEVMDTQIQKATTDAYKELIKDVQTYEQQRYEIQKEYKEKRESLYEDDGNGGKQLRQGVSEGNVKELNRKEEEDLSAIDETFAKREESYEAWCNSIANLSLKKLKEMLEQAQAEVEKYAKDPNANQQQVATTKAKVNTLKKKIKTEEASESASPGKRTVKEWEDLYKTLKDVESGFNDIGDAVGGTVGDIIDAAGSIASSTLSMINSIVTLANWSVTATQMSAEGASKAMQTIEKASVILAAIGAAMQIASTVVNLFNNDDSRQKEIDKLQERIDQLQWELDNADAVMSGKTLEAGSYLNEVKKAISDTRKEMILAAAATNNWYSVFKIASTKITNDTERMNKTASALAKTYANMSYTSDKELGESKYSSAEDKLKNIAEQQILIQNQIDEENARKNTDTSKIAEYEQKIEELGEEALNTINEMVENIIGGSASEIADELAEAFYDAFEAGEDAAEAWADKVNDIVGDILKNMMIQKFLEEPLGEIFNKYKEKWFPDGQFVGIDSIISSMNSFASDLNGTLDAFQEAMNVLPDDLKSYFIGETERDGSSSGIATASQDSVDELNGRATAIQSHTYSISENTKLLLDTTQSILRSVMNIESETDGFHDRMERVETNIKTINNTLDDIALRGIKIKG